MSHPLVECSICMELPFEVVSTPCGHNFCKRCLSDWSSKSLTCPNCKERLPSKALAVNIVLRDILQKWAADNNYTRNESKEEFKADGETPQDEVYSGRSISINRVRGINTPLWSCGEGHPLVVSEFRGGAYRGGWRCNNCARHGSGARWFCQTCEADVCFSCHPKDSTWSISESISSPASPPDGAPVCESGEHVMSLSDFHSGPYALGWVCNVCSTHGRGIRWFCSVCEDDYCSGCFPIAEQHRTIAAIAPTADANTAATEVPRINPHTIRRATPVTAGRVGALNYEISGGIQPICGKGGHRMEQSDYHQGRYAGGWVCRRCRLRSFGERWFCGMCQDDVCYTCAPPHIEIPAEVQGGPDVGEVYTDYSTEPLLCTRFLHRMKITNDSSGNYAGGWTCAGCLSPDTGYRWCCKACQEDFCFECRPNTTSLKISRYFHCVSGEHQMVVSGDDIRGIYSSWWQCDMCKHEGSGKRWCCKACDCDYCFNCRAEPV